MNFIAIIHCKFNSRIYFHVDYSDTRCGLWQFYKLQTFIESQNHGQFRDKSQSAYYKKLKSFCSL